MRQKIEFVELQERRVRIDNTEAFQLRKDRPCLWLQKACFFILRKIKAFHISEKFKVERRTIYADCFMERLFKQRAGIEKYFNTKPTTLLVGAEDYSEIMKEALINQSLSFRAEYNCGREIMGLTVKVIPWMSGILVMPPDNY